MVYVKRINAPRVKYCYIYLFSGCEKEVQYKEIYPGCKKYVNACTSANFDLGFIYGGYPRMALGDQCCTALTKTGYFYYDCPGGEFNPYAADFFQNIFHLFEAGIANAISSSK